MKMQTKLHFMFLLLPVFYIFHPCSMQAQSDRKKMYLTTRENRENRDAQRSLRLTEQTRNTGKKIQAILKKKI